MTRDGDDESGKGDDESLVTTRAWCVVYVTIVLATRVESVYHCLVGGLVGVILDITDRLGPSARAKSTTWRH
jgi:hypothetical protein